jgi:hypothetical protein
MRDFSAKRNTSGKIHEAPCKKIMKPDTSQDEVNITPNGPRTEA